MSPQNVNIIGSVKLFFKNYVNFSGRSTRSEYWWYILFNFIVCFVLLFVGSAFSVNTGINAYSANFIYNNYVYDIWLIATFIPSIALNVRRLHDTGRSWLYLLATFIPIVGSFLVLIWLAQPSDGDNMWGFSAETIATGRRGGQVYHTNQYSPNIFYSAPQQPTYNDPNAFYNGGQNQNYDPNGYYGAPQQGGYNNPNAPYQGYQNQGYQNQGGYNTGNQYGAPQQNYNPGQQGGNFNDGQGFGSNNINNNR